MYLAKHALHTGDNLTVTVTLDRTALREYVLSNTATQPPEAPRISLSKLCELAANQGPLV